MSRFKGGVLVVIVFALLVAPAAHAQSAVTARVQFAATTTQAQRAGAIRAAHGRVLKAKGLTVVARMSAVAASSLRTAMGVISVQY